MEKQIIEQLKELLSIQRNSIINEYMLGMYNGMELVRSVVEGDTPTFLSSVDIREEDLENLVVVSSSRENP